MTCACGNTARYVDEDGKLVCGTCPIRSGKDSIRLSDVPKLLAWARGYLRGPRCFDGRDDELRAIVGRDIRGK